MNTGTWYRSLLAGIVVLLSLSTTFAQFNLWDTEDGLPIRQGRHVTMGMDAVAGDGNGSILVAWAEASSGSMDIHAQLFSPSGEKLWTGDDITVAASPYPDQDAKAVHTSDNCWIIAWQDFSNDIERQGIGEIYLTKLDQLGNPVWDEPAGPLGETISYNYRWAVHEDNAGGATVAWHGMDGLQLQRVSSTGEAMWETLPTMVLQAADGICLDFTGDGGAVIMLGQYYGGDRSVTTQKINPDGTFAWGDDSAGLMLDDRDSNSYTRLNNPVQLSDGSYLVSWVDYREDELYMQKVSVDGTLLWESELLVDADIYQVDTRSVQPIDNNGVLIFVTDGLAPRAYDCSGDAPELLWQADELEDVDGGEIICSPLSNGDLLVSWSGWGPGGSTVQSQRLTSDGAWAWDQVRVLGEFDQLPHIGVVVVGDEAVTIWSDSEEDETGVWLRSQDLETGQPNSDTSTPIVTGVSGWTDSPIIARSGDTAFVGWTDLRQNPGGEMYYQVIDWNNGESRMAWNGAPLVDWVPLDENSSRYCYTLNVIPDGENGAIFAWLREVQRDTISIMAQRIDAEGNRLWGSHGKSLGMFAEQDMRFIEEFKVIMADPEFFVVASLQLGDWSDWRTIPSVAWFDLQGNIIGDGYYEPVPELEYLDAHDMSAYPTGDGDVILSYKALLPDYSAGGSHYLRLSKEHELVWEASNIQDHPIHIYDQVQLDQSGAISTVILGHATNTPLYNEVISLDGEWLIEPLTQVHEENLFGYELNVKIDPGSGDISELVERDGTIRYARYGNDGTAYISQEDAVQIATGYYPRAAVYDPDGGMYVIIIQYTPENPDIYFTHITREGTLASDLFGEEGRVVVDCLFDQSQICAIPDGEGGIAMVWNDWRGSLASEPLDDVYGFRFNDHTTGIRGGSDGPLPQEFVLLPAYPNPFNPSTSIRFTIPEASEVRLAIFDVLGRKVTTLLDGRVESGTHVVPWNGRDFTGQPVSSGTYFIQVRNQGMARAQRIVLLK